MINTVTAELLERLARTRRFSAQTLDIAKRLFLFNDPPRKLAAEYGVNLARIYAIRDTVSQAAQAQRVPPGWEEVTLIAPKELIEEFRQRIAEAQGQQGAEVGFPEPAAAAHPLEGDSGKKHDGTVPRVAVRKGKV